MMKPSPKLPPKIQRLEKTVQELHIAFKEGAPRASKKTISFMANNLGSLEEVSFEHLRILREIKKCRFPQDAEKLSTLLVHIEVNWLSVASYDLDELKEFLPRLLRHVTVPRNLKSERRKQR